MEKKPYMRIQKRKKIFSTKSIDSDLEESKKREIKILSINSEESGEGTFLGDLEIISHY